VNTRQKGSCSIDSLLDAESILDSLPVGVMIFDLRKEIVYSNRWLKSMLGAEKIEHSDCSSFMESADRRVLDEAIDCVINGEDTGPDFEITLSPPGGAAINVLTRISPLRDENGTIAAVTCVVRESQRLKQVIEEAKKSEQKYQQIVDNLHEGIWMIDGETRTSYVNRRMAEIMGYTVEEMLGRPMLEFIDNTRIEAAMRNLKRRSEGIREQVEFEFRRKDGAPVYLTIAASPFINENGSYSGAVAGIMDITERVMAEKALKESEARFQEAQKLANLGSWQWDAKTSAVSWSDEVFRIAGRDKADGAVSYQNLPSIYTRESWERLQKAISHALKTGEPYEVELELVRPDGRTRRIIARSKAVKDGRGAITGLNGTVLDITELKKAQEEAGEAYRLYRIIFENSEEGLMIATGSGKIIDSNPAACRMLGFSKEELLRLRRDDLLDCSDPYLLELLDRRQKTGFASGILSFKRKDGSTVPAEVSSRIFCDRNGEVHISIMFRDISERLKAENELKMHRDSLSEMVKEQTARLELSNEQLRRELNERLHAEKALRESEQRFRELSIELSRSNEELQLFVYTASHDLQEPLRKIATFTDRIRLHSGDRLDGKSLDYLARMENAANRMKQLIHGILELSRITTKHMVFRRVSLAGVLEDVLSDLEIIIGETGAEIELGEMPVLEADPVHMHQLFMNLIANSIKFCTAVPCITISCQSVSQDECTITVKDNGIGFDEKHLDDIFKPFHRLHDRGRYEGIGIGLTICQRVVSKHSGRITAVSSPEQGSTFVITLPARQTGFMDSGPAG
jgi:PAS domain S-box-containing protein